MARPGKPWWWAARGRWAATIDGRRHLAPPELKKKDEHAAWTWHAELCRGLEPIPTDTVQGLFEAYLQWDEGRVELGGRDRNSHLSACSTAQRACDTPLTGVRFGDHRVASIRPDHLDGLIAEWTRAGVSPGYRRSLASRVKAAFAWAARPVEGRGALVKASPFAGASLPAVPAPAERYAGRDEAAAWLLWLWRRGLRDFAQLQRVLVHTGARPSEVTGGTWADVKWDGERPAILRRERWKNSGKTGEARRVYLPRRLHRMLRRRMASPRPDGLMFATSGGLPWTPSNLAGAMARLRKEAIIAGVPLRDSGPDRMTCYRWRHTAASSLLMAGVAAATVAELLGTSVQYVTSTYGHLLSGHLADAADKLARRRS